MNITMDFTPSEVNTLRIMAENFVVNIKNAGLASMAADAQSILDKLPVATIPGAIMYHGHNKGKSKKGEVRDTKPYRVKVSAMTMKEIEAEKMRAVEGLARAAQGNSLKAVAIWENKLTLLFNDNKAEANRFYEANKAKYLTVKM